MITAVNLPRRAALELSARSVGGLPVAQRPPSGGETPPAALLPQAAARAGARVEARSAASRQALDSRATRGGARGQSRSRRERLQQPQSPPRRARRRIRSSAPRTAQTGAAIEPLKARSTGPPIGPRQVVDADDRRSPRAERARRARSRASSTPARRASRSSRRGRSAAIGGLRPVDVDRRHVGARRSAHAQKPSNVRRRASGADGLGEDARPAARRSICPGVTTRCEPIACRPGLSRARRASAAPRAHRDRPAPGVSARAGRAVTGRRAGGEASAAPGRPCHRGDEPAARSRAPRTRADPGEPGRSARPVRARVEQRTRRTRAARRPNHRVVDQSGPSSTERVAASARPGSRR